MSNTAEIPMLQAIIDNRFDSGGNCSSCTAKQLGNRDQGSILAQLAMKQAKAVVKRCLPATQGSLSITGEGGWTTMQK